MIDTHLAYFYEPVNPPAFSELNQQKYAILPNGKIY